MPPVPALPLDDDPAVEVDEDPPVDAVDAVVVVVVDDALGAPLLHDARIASAARATAVPSAGFMPAG